MINKVMPEPLLITTFTYLHYEEVVENECVCKRWKVLFTQPFLWKRLFATFFPLYQQVANQQVADKSLREQFHAQMLTLRVLVNPLEFHKDYHLTAAAMDRHGIDVMTYTASMPYYADSVFSYIYMCPTETENIISGEKTKYKAYYIVMRHKKSDVPPLDQEVELSASVVRGLVIRADGTSRRPDLAGYRFEASARIWASATYKIKMFKK